MAFQHWGFKRVGGQGLNGQIYRWEDLGGGLFRCHCSPGVAIATRIAAMTGGESFTEVYPFFTSGNVVSFPPAFDPYGAWGNFANAVLVGTTAHRARRGDSWHPVGVPALSGLRFWVERAEAGAGDDFSEATSNQWMQSATLGPMIRMDDLTAAGDVKVEVTDVETQFTGSTAGEWHSLGSLIVREILNRDRPYEDTDDPFDPSSMRVDWDRATVSNSDPIEIDTAYNGGAGNSYRTVVVSASAHGLSAGAVIEIAGSSTNPVIDGRQTVASVVDETTILLEHTGLIDGGTAGTLQSVGIEHLAVVGSHAFTFSKAFVGVLSVSTGALVLGANRARVSFTVDGVAQTPREAIIRSPYMSLGMAPEGTTAISIWRLDRQTGEWIEMIPGGASINPYDPFINYGINWFKFNGDTNEVYFHPLLAGDSVVAVFTTAEPVGLDGFGEPGVFFKDYQYPIVDRSYLKQCDILDIRDEAGILAAAGDLEGYEFNIGSHGVFRGPATVTHGAVPNNPATELSTGDYVEMPCNGKLIILEDGYQTLRNAGRYSNIRTDAGWMHREGMLHPDVIRMYVDGIGCLDTVQASIINGGTTLNVGSGWELIVATGEWVYDDCEILQFGGSTSTYVTGTHYDLVRIEGLARAPIHTIDFESLRHMPKGTTIDRASVELTAPASMVHIFEQWVQTSDGGSSFVAPVTSAVVSTPTFLIMGKTIGSSYYNAYLGTATLGGTIESGKKLVLEASDLFTKLLALKNSVYTDIAIMVSAYPGSTVALSDPSSCKAVGYSIIQGWFDFSYSPTTPFSSITYDISRIEFATPFIFGEAFVQFRFPDNTMKAYRYVYGNMPPMA